MDLSGRSACRCLTDATLTAASAESCGTLSLSRHVETLSAPGGLSMLEML